jgi:hypothetical protein
MRFFGLTVYSSKGVQLTASAEVAARIAKAIDLTLLVKAELAGRFDVIRVISARIAMHHEQVGLIV